jgi:hypothetical protein
MIYWQYEMIIKTLEDMADVSTRAKPALLSKRHYTQEIPTQPNRDIDPLKDPFSPQSSYTPKPTPSTRVMNQRPSYLKWP